MSLWKFNRTTGYWSHVRDCGAEGAHWLAVFEAGDPQGIYRLTVRKPKPMTWQQVKSLDLAKVQA